MGEMRGAAMAYYANLSSEQQFQAWNLYKQLDSDGDGTVRVQGYSDFLKDKGRGIWCCDECGVTLSGINFVCAKCYEAGGTTYELCCGSFRIETSNTNTLFSWIILLCSDINNPLPLPQLSTHLSWSGSLEAQVMDLPTSEWGAVLGPGPWSFLLRSGE
ncbi:hypothetical protein TEA_028550 [Camellia sinensis var. sinensis]|uniref:EF-hand domain-containing protein n=1 Tax=Camellia sinensis var. sinensis TaxID=542762 RepID=A0A4S4DVX4_CAMSN|nr:hypothetical protein TEA_028550 [Camellia sinensis var. sinensis]